MNWLKKIVLKWLYDQKILRFEWEKDVGQLETIFKIYFLAKQIGKIVWYRTEVMEAESNYIYECLRRPKMKFHRELEEQL